MRVATAAEMAAIDRETIAGGTTGLELMERAGRAMAAAILAEYPSQARGEDVAVCCGRGNNGGDGLVVARCLAERGAQVTVQMPSEATELAPDAAFNLDLLPRTVAVVRPQPEDAASTWKGLQLASRLAVDALFGTGIRPPLRDHDARLVASFDPAASPIVSLDIPSGVCGDDGVVDPVAVRADLTLAVGLPKLGHLLHPGREHVGRLEVLDIGFPREIRDAHTGALRWWSPGELAAWRPSRPASLHKYEAGTVLVVAGSRRYGGAALLAARGALRSGAGLVTLALPKEHAVAALGFVPEALIDPLETGTSGGLRPLSPAALESLLARQRAWAVGPGLGADPETDAWLVKTLSHVPLPLVVDADGLSAFARRGRLPDFITDQVVLTPHAGELARLAQVDAEILARERFTLVPELARRWNAVLVAKGSPTLIATPDGELTLNGTGHDALAVGGTGDVLTGLIGGLLAQGADARVAAILGCWLHGRAGELLAAEQGTRRGLLAREVADALPSAQADLEHRAYRECG